MLALQKNDVFADRYLLLDLIGTRGISEVWACEDLQDDGAIVAVKLYSPLDKTDELFLQKLKQDASINQSVRHPNLLQIRRFDIYAGTPFLVMSYMEQGSLRKRLLENGPLKEYEIAVLLKQIGGALHHLHTAEPEQLHENIKPDNILITEDADYVLADFRIHNKVKVLLPRKSSQPEGTPTAYAPPELFTVRPDMYKASDIFALGVTIYELCTGQLPWMGNGGLSLLQGASVPYLPPSYSKELNKIVTACMDPKWENRPTAEELALEGNYFIDNDRWKPYGRFSVAKVDVVQYKKGSPLKVAIWIGAILLALSAAGYYLYTQTDQLQTTFGTIARSDENTTDTLTLSESSDNEGLKTTPEEPARAQETAVTVNKPAAPPKEETVSRPVSTAVKTPAPPATQAATTPALQPEPKKTAYPAPASAEEYLAQLQNKKIPQNVREGWRKDVWRFFDRRASVNYVVGNELVGILSADELVDIMLDRENTGSIRIDSTRKNAAGKVEQVFVYVPESVANEEEQ